MRVRTIALVIVALVGPAEAGHYVRVLHAQQRFLPAEIDAGGRLYLANCTGCHGPEGNGVAGVDFSQGKFRRGADLMRSLVDPDGEVRPENRTIRVVLKDGRTINGRLLNQDTFSIQLIDAADKMLSIDKSTVRESSIQSRSPMPSFKDKLSAQELADVVSYLSSLKGRP